MKLCSTIYIELCPGNNVSEEFPLLAIHWAIEWTLEYVLICREVIKVTLVLMQKTEKQYRTYYTNDLIFPDIEMSRRSAATLNCEYLSSLLSNITRRSASCFHSILIYLFVLCWKYHNLPDYLTVWVPEALTIEDKKWHNIYQLRLLSLPHRTEDQGLSWILISGCRFD